MKGYTTAQLARLAGISPTRLEGYLRAGLIRPSIAGPRGSGRGRALRWSYEDLVAVRVVVYLQDHGSHLEALRPLPPVVQALALDGPAPAPALVVDEDGVRILPGPHPVLTLVESPGPAVLLLLLERFLMPAAVAVAVGLLPVV